MQLLGRRAGLGGANLLPQCVLLKEAAKECSGLQAVLGRD